MFNGDAVGIDISTFAAQESNGMKKIPCLRQCWIFFLLVVCGNATFPNRLGASPLYTTGFEVAEGYDTNFALAGQAGWLFEGSGGNGLVDGAFPGMGQQGYVGKFAPSPGYDYLFVWQPFNFDPATVGASVIKFSTEMSIMPATTGEADEFAWIAFNSQFQPLFIINFENYYQDIYFKTNGGAYEYSQLTYTNGIIYTLSITMDFGANLWSASLDNRLIATNRPLAGAGLTLDLADMDAAWLIYDVNQPCDNYMIFDNYKFTPLPDLTLLNRAANGQVTLRAVGREGWKLAIEASTNLTQWTSLKTNPVAGGSFDYVDTGAATLPRRFYRARIVP